MAPKIGGIGHAAAEVNRNLEEIRRRNLLGKREVIHKPPTALKKPPVIKVLFHSFLPLDVTFHSGR